MSDHSSQVIPTTQYPQLLPQSLRGSAMRMLRSRELHDRADNVISKRNQELRRAVLKYIEQLDLAAVAGDWNTAYWQAHEIRGLAGNADLTLAGRLANLFCVYLDGISELGQSPDPAVAALHLDAMDRSIEVPDDANQFGDSVFTELSLLVGRSLRALRLEPSR